MSRIAISVHDAPAELYNSLPVDEQDNNGTFWKIIETPSVTITFLNAEKNMRNFGKSFVGWLEARSAQ
jgi:hypothetical protein